MAAGPASRGGPLRPRGAGAAFHMADNVTLHSLPPSGRTLVELMRRLHYGQVQDLHVRGGQPVFDPAPRLVRDIKLVSETLPRPEAGQQDYLLKEQVLELLRYLERVRDGVIDAIEVKDGLPFRV